MGDTQKKITDIQQKEKEFLSKIGALPTLPVIFKQIIASLEDPDTSAGKLKDIIIKDQTIASKLLKLVNSAYFGLSKPVDDIKRAIIILGFGTIKSVALSVSLLSKFAGAKTRKFKTTEFWIHSISVAELCKYISGTYLISESDHMYTLGLLHDIGKILLEIYFSSEYSDVLEMAENENIPITNAEMKYLGFDHSIAGFWLGKQWKFPDSLLIPIRNHHTLPGSETEFDLETRLVTLSDSIIKQNHIGFSGDSIVPELKMPQLEYFNFNSRHADEFREFAVENLDNIRNFMQLVN